MKYLLKPVSVLIALFLILNGCNTTTLETASINAILDGSDNTTGFVLISNGMRNLKSPGDPDNGLVIDHRIYALDGSGNIKGEQLVVIRGDQSKDVFNHINTSRNNEHVYANIVDLPAGDFLVCAELAGEQNRFANNVPQRGLSAVAAEHKFIITVEAGKLTYAGCILSVKPDLALDDAFEIQDRFNRETEAVFKKRPALKNLPLVKHLARKNRTNDLK